MIQMGLAKPFVSRNHNRLELFNESLVYYTTIFSILFTNYSSDKELSYQAGWIIILLVSLGVLLNISFHQSKKFN
jgi:uncharacterized Rmd1/YagE family protein